MKNSKKCIALFLSIFFLANINAQEQALSLAKNDDFSWFSVSQPRDVASGISDASGASLHVISLVAHCFCKVSFKDLTGQSSPIFGIISDLTGAVNKTYTLQNESNQEDCKTRCATQTSALSSTQKQAIADYACGAAVADNTMIASYSSVGTKEYRFARNVGRLVNTPEQSTTTCTCPSGWLANIAGPNGTTEDGKCHKTVCGPMTFSPLPPNNTAIGTWGFVRGNLIQVWGNPANGGAAVCKTVVYIPKECKL